MGCGMMYHPGFRNKMRELAEEDAAVFRFRGGGRSDTFSDALPGIFARLKVARGTAKARWYNFFNAIHQPNHWVRNMHRARLAYRSHSRGRENIKALRRAWGLNSGGRLDAAEARRRYRGDNTGSDPKLIMDKAVYRKFLADEEQECLAGYNAALKGYEESLNAVRMQMSYFSENPAADEIADVVGGKLFDSHGVRRKYLDMRRCQRLIESGKYVLPEASQLRTAEDEERVVSEALSVVDSLWSRDWHAGEIRNLRCRKLGNMHISLDGMHAELMVRGKRRGIVFADNFEVKRAYLERCLRHAVDWSGALSSLRRVHRDAGAPCTFVADVYDAVGAVRGVSSKKQLVVEYFPGGRPACLTPESNILPGEVTVPLAVGGELCTHLLGFTEEAANSCFVAYVRAEGDAGYAGDRITGTSVPSVSRAVSLEIELAAFLAAGERDRTAYIAACERELLSGGVPSDEQIYTYVRYLSLNPQLAGDKPADNTILADCRLKRGINYRRGVDILSNLNRTILKRSPSPTTVAGVPAPTLPCFGSDAAAIGGAPPLDILNPDTADAYYAGTAVQWHDQIAHEASCIADQMLALAMPPALPLKGGKADGNTVPAYEATFGNINTYPDTLQEVTQESAGGKFELKPGSEEAAFKGALAPFFALDECYLRDEFLPMLALENQNSASLEPVSFLERGKRIEGQSVGQCGRLVRDPDTRVMPIALPGKPENSHIVGYQDDSDVAYPACYIPGLHREKQAVAAQGPQNSLQSAYGFFKAIGADENITVVMDLTNSRCAVTGGFNPAGNHFGKVEGPDFDPFVGSKTVLPYTRAGGISGTGLVLSPGGEKKEARLAVNISEPTQPVALGCCIEQTEIRFSLRSGSFAIRERPLTVLHFSSWMDRQTVSVQDMHDMVLAVRNAVGDAGGIPLVHCRDGVGRTGTFITCMLMADYIDEGLIANEGDIPNIVNASGSLGRAHRSMLYIQTPQQPFIINFARFYFALSVDEREDFSTVAAAAVDEEAYQLAGEVMPSYICCDLADRIKHPPQPVSDQQDPDENVISMGRFGLYSKFEPIESEKAEEFFDRQIDCYNALFEAGGGVRRDLAADFSFTAAAGLVQGLHRGRADPADLVTDELSMPRLLLFHVNNSSASVLCPCTPRISSLIFLMALHKSGGRLLEEGYRGIPARLCSFPDSQGGAVAYPVESRAYSAEGCLSAAMDIDQPSELFCDLAEFSRLCLAEEEEKITGSCWGSLEIAEGFDHYRVVHRMRGWMISKVVPAGLPTQFWTLMRKCRKGVLCGVADRYFSALQNKEVSREVIPGVIFGKLGGIPDELAESDLFDARPYPVGTGRGQFLGDVRYFYRMLRVAVEERHSAGQGPTAVANGTGDTVRVLEHASNVYIRILSYGIGIFQEGAGADGDRGFLFPFIGQRGGYPAGHPVELNERTSRGEAFSRTSDHRMESLLLDAIGRAGPAALASSPIKGVLFAIAMHSPDTFHACMAKQLLVKAGAAGADRLFAMSKHEINRLADPRCQTYCRVYD